MLLIMKKIIISLVVVIIIGAGIYFYMNREDGTGQNNTPITSEPQATTTVSVEDKSKTIIGSSVEGLPILAYHFGEGENEVLFVGGIHGGYSWNTSIVAYELMDYLKSDPSAVPAGVKVTVIPVLNPDGLNSVVGTTSRFTAKDVTASREAQIAARFNVNNVDLNRNFDCEWKANGTWQKTQVSGGTAPFSEPESKALKNYIDENSPKAAVIYYSSAGGVYSSKCGSVSSAETKNIAKLYSDASGYPAYDEFDFYEVTGDAANWIAKQNIPAISILLTNHEDSEWNKNKAGIRALLGRFAI